MSDEQKNHDSHSMILLIIMITISLVVSIVALTTSLLSFSGNGSERVARVTEEKPAAAKPAEEGKKVVISKQFDKGQSFKKAKATGKPMVVFFYTDWCGFCQRFAPVYDKIAKSKEIKKNVAIAYVNCEDPANEDLAREYEVSGYPTVYVIRKDGEKTKLANGTFFRSNSVEIVTKDILDFVNK